MSTKNTKTEKKDQNFFFVLLDESKEKGIIWQFGTKQVLRQQLYNFLRFP